RVDVRVAAAAVLAPVEVVAQEALAPEARPLEHAQRGPVARLDEGLDPPQPTDGERPPRQQPDCGRREAAAAGAGEHPVADAGRARLDLDREHPVGRSTHGRDAWPGAGVQGDAAQRLAGYRLGD